ncbi:MAG: hypothetical protein H6712_24375 [Myxococcales bacterium]|nr:hypothetical protein [Myxococcales bacterium]
MAALRLGLHEMYHPWTRGQNLSLYECSADEINREIRRLTEAVFGESATRWRRSQRAGALIIDDFERGGDALVPPKGRPIGDVCEGFTDTNVRHVALGGCASIHVLGPNGDRVWGLARPLAEPGEVTIAYREGQTELEGELRKLLPGQHLDLYDDASGTFLCSLERLQGHGPREDHWGGDAFGFEMHFVDRECGWIAMAYRRADVERCAGWDFTYADFFEGMEARGIRMIQSAAAGAAVFGLSKTKEGEVTHSVEPLLVSELDDVSERMVVDVPVEPRALREWVFARKYQEVREILEDQGMVCFHALDRWMAKLVPVSRSLTDGNVESNIHDASNVISISGRQQTSQVERLEAENARLRVELEQARGRIGELVETRGHKLPISVVVEQVGRGLSDVPPGEKPQAWAEIEAVLEADFEEAIQGEPDPAKRAPLARQRRDQQSERARGANKVLEASQKVLAEQVKEEFGEVVSTTKLRRKSLETYLEWVDANKPIVVVAQGEEGALGVLRPLGLGVPPPGAISPRALLRNVRRYFRPEVPGEATVLAPRLSGLRPLFAIEPPSEQSHAFAAVFTDANDA